MLAITSHVPHLIAYNIVGTAADLEAVTQSEVIKFSAGGFRDFTRIAASDPTMWRDVFLHNKEAVLEMLGRFSEDLSLLARAIRWGDGDDAATTSSPAPARSAAASSRSARRRPRRISAGGGPISRARKTHARHRERTEQEPPVFEPQGRERGEGGLRRRSRGGARKRRTRLLAEQRTERLEPIRLPVRLAMRPSRPAAGDAQFAGGAVQMVEPHRAFRFDPLPALREGQEQDVEAAVRLAPALHLVGQGPAREALRLASP